MRPLMIRVRSTIQRVFKEHRGAATAFAARTIECHTDAVPRLNLSAAFIEYARPAGANP